MRNEEPVQCPQELLDAAGKLPTLRTAVANAGTSLVMESVRDAALANIIEPILFGEAREIEARAEELGWDIHGLRIVEADSEQAAAALAAKAAGAGNADAVMKGHVHTSDFMRAVLNKDAGLRTDRRLSHIFAMSIPGRDEPLLLSDCALNVAPEPETLQAILLNAIDIARSLELEKPRVALLSASEEVTDKVPSSVIAAELADWAKNHVENAHVAGPLAMDLAVSPEAADIKSVEHPVAGEANAIIVPEIIAGNALFKALVHFNRACAAGVVLGAKVPVLLTSRADPPAARLASAAVAAMYKDFQARQG